MSVNGIDNPFLGVAKIQHFARGQSLTNATGPVRLHDDYLSLVTYRHVEMHEAIDHRPDRPPIQRVEFVVRYI